MEIENDDEIKGVKNTGYDKKKRLSKVSKEQNKQLNRRRTHTRTHTYSAEVRTKEERRREYTRKRDITRGGELEKLN